MQNLEIYQWLIVILGSLVLIWIAPYSKTVNEFFRATKENKQPGFWILTSSLVISWIFAKSITNAANLGLSFGMVGGVAYSAYYLSFLVAGIIIYRMRTKGGFKSIHQFLESRYGKGAMLVFSVLIAIRLFNEVWSNTMVIGTYFGEQGSTSYFASILIFTALTLIYSLKGGLRSSLLTDLIQMILFGVLLFIILGILIPQEGGKVSKFVSTGEWTMAGGLNLLFVAFIQVFSYPFHDPVLTDRAFIAPPKTTLNSFILATFIGALCIIMFSFVGIYASFKGVEGQAAVKVSQLLGGITLLSMNFIMVTSAASTLDSTFASFSKLAVLDLGKPQNATVSKGRIAMVVLVIIGTLPVFMNPEILSATTVSGTMVLGLAPVFLFWNYKMPKISYHLSVGTGLVMGVLLAGGWVPESWIFFDGKYGDLLSINIIGTILSFVLFCLPRLWSKLYN